jgi:hypothetical protein
VRTISWARVRSILSRLLSLLAAGAAVNVAVAWGCAWNATPPPMFLKQAAYELVDFGHNRLGSFEVGTDLGFCRVVMWAPPGGVPGDGVTPPPVAHPGGLPAWARSVILAAVTADPEWPGTDLRGVPVNRWDDAAGWPLKALRCTSIHRRGRLAVHGGVTIPTPPGSQLMEWNRGRLLPLRPLWPGFATNTLCYAALVGLLFFGPGRLRRRLRIGRRLCPHCAYPVGGSSVCTECGRPVGGASHHSGPCCTRNTNAAAAPPASGPTR